MKASERRLRARDLTRPGPIGPANCLARLEPRLCQNAAALLSEDLMCRMLKWLHFWFALGVLCPHWISCYCFVFRVGNFARTSYPMLMHIAQGKTHCLQHALTLHAIGCLFALVEMIMNWSRTSLVADSVNLTSFTSMCAAAMPDPGVEDSFF